MQSLTTRERNIRTLSRTSCNSLTEIGLLLREAREKHSLSLKDIREITCIPLHHISAIETGSRSKLPEDFYLVGFIKRYARTLGLDEKSLCDRYLNEKKYTNSNNEADAFNLLFQEKRSKNILPFHGNQQKKSDNYTVRNSEEKNFIRVYHFYYLILFFLFVTASYSIYKTFTIVSDEHLSGSYLVLENDNTNTNSEPNINYDEVESWVGGEGKRQKAESKKLKVEMRHEMVQTKQNVSETLMTTKELKNNARRANANTLVKIDKKPSVLTKTNIVVKAPQKIDKPVLVEENKIKLRPLRQISAVQVDN